MCASPAGDMLVSNGHMVATASDCVSRHPVAEVTMLDGMSVSASEE